MAPTKPFRESHSACRDVNAVAKLTMAMRERVGAMRERVGAMRERVGAVHDRLRVMRERLGAWRQWLGRTFDYRARRRRNAAAYPLYDAIVAQARAPGFYIQGQVPDTLDGRFDMIVLHAYLVMRRLRGAGGEGAALAQATFDVMFADMDRGLREMGVGDLSVGKRVKAMARGFFGRVAAYDRGLDGEETQLVVALRRNLYGTASPDAASVARMASYARAADAALAGQSIAELCKGAPAFPPPMAAARGAGSDAA